METLDKSDSGEGDVFSMETYIRYLRTYVGFNADWQRHLGYVWAKVARHDSAKMQQLVSAAILLPAVDRSTSIDRDRPENLLLRMGSFHQLEERDWFELFKKTYAQDQNIDQWRMQCLSLGIVDPIDYQPISRQAYRWLFERAQERGCISSDEVKDDVASRFKKLVQAYGGAVICNIFSRHDGSISRLVNWRTGYFFERNIFNVYKIDDVVKIKTAELQKVNKSLVKTIKFS